MKIINNCLFCDLPLYNIYIDHWHNKINYNNNSCQNINCMYLNKIPRFSQSKSLPEYLNIIIDFKNKYYFLNIYSNYIICHEMSGYSEKFIFKSSFLLNSKEFSIKILEKEIRKYFLFGFK